MILIRYILKELFRNQLVVAMLLFLVCFCQKLIKALGLIVDSNVSAYLVFVCLMLNMPEAGKLIIPFSVFISVLITFYKLQIHNEIIAMYSCAISKSLFVKSVFFFSGIIAIFALINVGWLSPYCSSYQNGLWHEMRENINLSVLSERKFRSLSTKYLTLFIDKIQDEKWRDIFLVKKNKDEDHDVFIVITADQGHFCQKSNGSQLITLENGRYYEISNKCDLHKNCFVTNFSQYKMLINNFFKISCKQNESVHYMSIYKLYQFNTIETKSELYWRLTLLISIFIMPMITMLLVITISCRYFLNFLLIFVLYLSFFLLHILIRSYANLGTIDLMVWVWLINIFYILIVLLLNFWNNFYIKKIFFKIFHHNHIKN